MKAIAFSPEAFKEYNDWFSTDVQIVERIRLLIRDISREPFKGLGKPEPLKGNYSGYWSRRIDNEHRLIYKVTDAQIFIVKCKGHY